MKKKGRRTKATGENVFVRACSLKRFPTEKEAVEHARLQAADAGVKLGGVPTVTQKKMYGGSDAWVVEFPVILPERKRTPVVVDDGDTPEPEPTPETSEIIKHATGRYRFEVNGTRYRTLKEAEANR